MTRVRDLTPAGALTGLEKFYADSTVADVYVTANQLKTFAGAGTGTTTGAHHHTENLIVAASDETTPITTGFNKVKFRIPYDFVLVSVNASLNVAQTSGLALTVDVNLNGVSLLVAPLTFDNSEKTTLTAAVPPVVSAYLLPRDAEISVDVDQIGNGTAAGLKITLVGWAQEVAAPAPLTGTPQEATDFFARLSQAPSAPYTVAYTDLINTLLGAGIWDKLDVLCLAAAETQADALTNLISSSYNGTSQGTVSFTANEGFNFDGSTGYIDTGFCAGTANGNYTLNSACFGVRILDVPATSSPANTPIAMGCETYQIAENNIGLNSSTEETTLWINDDGYGAPKVVLPQYGSFAINRSSGSFKQAYHDGAPIMLSNWQSGPTLAVNNFFVGSGNDNGNGAYAFYDGRISSWFIGSSLTPDEHITLYNAIKAFDDKSLT